MKFKDLPDGTEFRVTLDMKAGMDVVYVKAVEDGARHNAVRVDTPSQTVSIPPNFEVTPV